MSKMVTRCPQCQTSFRVTEEHLKIANGAVRCGSCLHVFQAREHWVDDKPATAPPPSTRPTSGIKPISVPSFLKSNPPAEPAAPAKPAGKFQFDQAAIDGAKTKNKLNFDQSAIDNSSAASLLKEPDKRIPETALTRAHATAAPATPQHIDSDDTVFGDDGPATAARPATSAAATAPPQKSAAKDFGTEDDDYSSLFDGEDDVTAVTADEYSGLLDDDLDALTGDYENAPDDSQLGEESAVEPADEDAAWAKELLKELEDAPAPVTTHTPSAPSTHYIDPIDADVARRDLGIDENQAYSLAESAIRSSLTDASDEGLPSPVAPIDEPSPAARRQERERPRHAPLFGQPEEQPILPETAERTALLARIQPDVIHLQGAAEDRQKRREFIRELSVCLVLAVLLVAQGIGFNFTVLAKQESTRPAMEALCQVLRCELPPSQRWRYIRITNLVVRPDASIPGALVVDAIITNASRQDLPFPALELYFNDIDQLPVASRRFQPPEYVKGELLGQTLMPPGRPIHIALTVMNPGEKAVNWQMNVTPFD